MTIENTPHLITIILSLLLAMAFFSGYAIDKFQENSTDKKEEIHRVALETFIVGIMAIFFLHIGCNFHTFSKTFETLGNAFAGAFIFLFLWFLIYPLKKGLEAGGNTWWKELFSSESIIIALLIFLLIILFYLFKNNKII